MEGMSPDKMSAQAQQIWSMLDDMAENNPAAYRKFIDKQMQEGKVQLMPPEPHMCVEVLLLSKPHRPLFINFMSWPRLPEPKSSEDAVPVTGTPVTQEKGDSGPYALTSVAFNPKVLEEYGRHCRNQVDADTLIQLALDYIEHEHKIKVTRNYTVLPADSSYKGELGLVQMSFSKKFKKQDEEFEKEMNNMGKMFGPMAADSNGKDSLLSQLSNITVNNKSPDSSNMSPPSTGDQTPIVMSTSSKTPPKAGLIEEIPSTRKVSTPKYSLEPHDAGVERCLVLTVELPGVASVSECELDICEDDVQLLVPGRYELKVKLPSCIDDDKAGAKFSKKLSILTVTMPVKT